MLEAYQLHAFINGHPVDGNSIDWGSVDMRSVSFQQPPGPKNPLGDVKFMFPNKHDVYMHDTPERELFSRTDKAFSHGCMRVKNPRRLAEVLLAEDKGWSSSQVGSAIAGGGTGGHLVPGINVCLQAGRRSGAGGAGESVFDSLSGARSDVTRMAQALTNPATTMRLVTTSSTVMRFL